MKLNVTKHTSIIYLKEEINIKPNMTIDQIKQTYTALIDSESVKLAHLKANIFRIGSLRLAVVLACIAICYLLWGNGGAVVATIGVSVVVFLFLLKYHNRLFIRKRYCELLILNAENELKGIDYDFSPFDGAPEYIDGNHSYSLDLDLFGNPSFFRSINRSVTDYGKKRLADTLLYPFTEKEKIEQHQQAVKELSTRTDLITHFRASGQMNDKADLDVANLTSRLAETKQLKKTGWRFMPHLSVLSFVLVGIALCTDIPMQLPLSYAALWWGVMTIVSLIPIKIIREKIGHFEKNIEALQTYSKLFRIIENETFDSELLRNIQQNLKGEHTASQAIQQLKSHSNNLDQSSTVLGFLFLNPVLFWNVIYGIKIENWIEKYEGNISRWFDTIAAFDALVSFGLYAYNHPDYTYPEVSDTPMFTGKDMGHPMLRRDVCVRNDVTVAKRPFFLVVTGANMAGKSTYLRTVGINMTLACAGAPVCASSLTFYPYHLVTNLRTSDSLADNESYFFAELKRLKMIIDRLQSGEELFIILDEILKGTNSEDKQKGSIALMKQLIGLGGNGIIATHDLVLGNLEKEYPGEVKDYRFEADITDEQLTFSYKIREGVAQNINACFLMKKMGITGL